MVPSGWTVPTRACVRTEPPATQSGAPAPAPRASLETPARRVRGHPEWGAGPGSSAVTPLALCPLQSAPRAGMGLAASSSVWAPVSLRPPDWQLQPNLPGYGSLQPPNPPAPSAATPQPWVSCSEAVSAAPRGHPTDWRNPTTHGVGVSPHRNLLGSGSGHLGGGRPVRCRDGCGQKCPGSTSPSREQNPEFVPGFSSWYRLCRVWLSTAGSGPTRPVPSNG